MDQKINNANITIHSNYDFSLNNSKIWAFGNNGTINFNDGNIVLNSNGELSSSQYMVAGYGLDFYVCLESTRI